MKVDEDGVPVKGMLWRQNSDGTLQNKTTGFVLQIAHHSVARKVEVVADKLVKGDTSQQWSLMDDGTIVNASNHTMLTVRNGSMKSGAEVWCNRKQPLLGVTAAQKWNLISYDGEPKMPSYAINPEVRALLDGQSVNL